MAGEKDYVLTEWPRNNTISNTKKYRVIKKSPVPLLAKILVAAVLIALTVLVVPRYWHDATSSAWRMAGCGAGLLVVNEILRVVYQVDREESIMLLKNIGIEMTSATPGRLFFLGNVTRETFVPIGDVVDIIIHEGFVGLEVIFYMAIIRENANELTLVFENLLPRRPQLEYVLKGSRKVLFSGRTDNKLTIPGHTASRDKVA